MLVFWAHTFTRYSTKAGLLEYTAQWNGESPSQFLENIVSNTDVMQTHYNTCTLTNRCMISQTTRGVWSVSITVWYTVNTCNYTRMSWLFHPDQEQHFVAFGFSSTQYSNAPMTILKTITQRSHWDLTQGYLLSLKTRIITLHSFIVYKHQLACQCYILSLLKIIAYGILYRRVLGVCKLCQC